MTQDEIFSMQFVYGVYLLLLSNFVVSAVDYCQYVCGNGEPNLACRHTQKPDPSCVDFKQFDMGEREQKLAVGEHNKKRTLVAAGEAYTGDGVRLPTATNMNILSWDDELAFLAYLNILQCKMQHDKCRNTETANGQNLFQASTNAKRTIDEILRKGVASWYGEIRDVKLDDILDFKLTPNRVIGHFTQLVWAKSTKVGCAACSYRKPDTMVYLLACNYVSGNVMGAKVYEPGQYFDSTATFQGVHISFAIVLLLCLFIFR